MNNNPLKNNQSGVALIMVLMSIVILLAIWAEFTFESKINRIKTTNILDKAQAKLMAEAGLKLAITRLRLYKEAYNKIQSNQGAKSVVPPQLLNQLWEIPFYYPIPLTKDASSTVKNTILKFEEESLLEGEMKVTTQSMANKLNLNLLRVSLLEMFQQKAKDPSSTIDQEPKTHIFELDPLQGQNEVSISQNIYNTLRRLVELRRIEDELFAQDYGNLNYQQLIANLSFYISDKGLRGDSFLAEAESEYLQNKFNPKYAPYASVSELYLIPGWDDVLVEMIENEFSVFPSIQIDLNNLTENLIRLLIPNLMDDQIRLFFEYKNDPNNRVIFNTVEDFKRYVVNIANWMTSNAFDERFKLFQDKGFEFGPNPYMFKIISEGVYNRSSYTLVAYVSMAKGAAAQTPKPVPNKPDPAKPVGGGAPTTPTTGQLIEPVIIELQIL